MFSGVSKTIKKNRLISLHKLDIRVFYIIVESSHVVVNFVFRRFIQAFKIVTVSVKKCKYLKKK